MPAKTITRAKEVLLKLEQYELAVFANTKQNSDVVEKETGRVEGGKLSAQFSLFASSNESVINDLRGRNFQNMTNDELRIYIDNIQNRIV